MTTREPATLPLTTPPAARLTSLDALRGFDMFWIVGGKPIVQEAAKLWQRPWLVWLAAQLEHPVWHGFTLYDLIFPLFLFIAGVAMPFSFASRLARGATKADLYRHAVVRGLALVALGTLYNENGPFNFDWPNSRLPSVLGCIGLAYMAAALIVLNTGVRGQLAWIAGLLIGYWAALKFVPVPGFGAGDLTPGHTLTDYLDRLLIPGILLRGDRDPQGLLATLSATATALAGVVTGHLLRSERLGGYAKAGMMIAAGAACVGVGWLWDSNLPINKNLWSSSFVVYTAGWSLLLLAFFYLVIDVWGWKKWAFPWVVIGSNSILAYMAWEFVDFKSTSQRLFGGALRHTGGYEPLLLACGTALLMWLLLYLLYRKRIFLKV